MHRVPPVSLSPDQTGLGRRGTRSCSPPAMVSIGAFRPDSRPPGLDSMFNLTDDVLGDNSVLPYQGARSDHSRSSGRSLRSSTERQRPTNTGSVNTARASQPLSSGSLLRQEPFYATTEQSSLRQAYLGLDNDADDGVVSYGPLHRPSSPSLRGHSTTTTEPWMGQSTGSSSGGRAGGVDNFSIPSAMLQGQRPPEPPSMQTQRGAASVPRRSSGGATPSMPGPGGMRLDSILISSSQVLTSGMSPSRESTAKRSSRFANRISDDGNLAGKTTSGSRLMSPSLTGQRKKTSVSIEKMPLSGRSGDSIPSSMEGSMSLPRVSRNMRVSLAHKALIGKGSYGMVFQAMDRDTNRIIAVKEIALGGSGTSSGRNFSATNSSADAKRSLNGEDTVLGSLPSSNGVVRSPNKAGRPTEFQRQLEAVRKELAVLKQLDHPNIVKCLGEECDDSYLRIYMEFVAGGSVSSLLRRFGNLQERQASNFTQQMLHGLAYLHSKGIVHRDLKGDNLLVDPSGVLKLADFGTARDMQIQTQTNAIAGTANFMAPEVMLGNGSGPHSDIWSVGCCVIEMLSGRPPLAHLKNQYSIMMFIAEAKNDLYAEYVPVENNWSSDALDFLRQCLRRDPAQRPTAVQLLSHPWITNPTQSDHIRSPVTAVLTTTAISHMSLPSPPPLSQLRPDMLENSQRTESVGAPGGSCATTDLDPLTPASDGTRKRKKDRKSRKSRDREKKRGSSNSSAGKSRRKNGAPSPLGSALQDYDLNPDLLFPLSRSPATVDGGGSSLGGTPRAASPRPLGRRGGSASQQPHPPGAQTPSEVDHLPDIRAHSSTVASNRSPFLPALGTDKTPSSAHAFMKLVNSNSMQRDGGTDVNGSRWHGNGSGGNNAKSIPTSSGLSRSSGYEGGLAGARGSGFSAKSPTRSREMETPMRSARYGQSPDDVVVRRDDLARGPSGKTSPRLIVSPPQPQRKMKPTASPRMPPLISPPADRKSGLG